MNLSRERLQQLLEYDADTGKFRWRVKRSGVSFEREPGTITKHGYRVINIDRRHHFAHRLAWLYETGFPPQEIDHINGDRQDNRWANLRVVTRGENSQNRSRARRDNLSCGLLGVTWDKQRELWKARIFKDNIAFNLGHHKTAEAAHRAYLQAKRRLHISTAL